jgi:FKBP-type peptidyl-prolyl cis-trans isomerase SlyD
MKHHLAGGLVVLLLTGGRPAYAEDLAIVDGLQVSFEYTLTLKDKDKEKTVVDSNVGKEPVTYVHGQKQIVPGLEKALAGLKPGQSKHVEIPSAEAYGPYDDKARLTVEKSQVPPDVKAGTMLAGEDGQPVKVIEVSEEKVVLDLNHPLAGKDLVFDVKIVKVEKEKVAPVLPPPGEAVPQPVVPPQ